jgi:hypothetical protein
MKRESRKIKVQDYRNNMESGPEFVSRVLMRERVCNVITTAIPIGALIAVALMVYYGP